jgi:hypothetical protein
VPISTLLRSKTSSPLAPGRTGAALAGIAAWSEQRDGARSRFSLVFTYMEPKSRSMALDGHIHCAMGVLLLIACR